ncbi:hypothetical protein DFP72DRAFT_1062662 [Ephemerocybe angulata]|uniref:Uncharacterized protein n=1 Tax=Ephemerocybe angulata TaxID=980116 RepID=A0A8H6IAK1_9AGAR|nr:hypothetical protein DFP72DRAFT_1062662 [Tulosesus angulatus]
MSSRSMRKPSTTPSQSDALQHATFLALSPTGYPSNNNTQSFHPPTAPRSSQPRYTAYQPSVQPSTNHAQGHSSTGRTQPADIPTDVRGGSFVHPQFPLSQPEPGSSSRPPAHDVQNLPLEQLLEQAPRSVRDLVAASTGVTDFTSKFLPRWDIGSDKEEGYYTVSYTPPGGFSFRVRRNEATREVKKKLRNEQQLHSPAP